MRSRGFCSANSFIVHGTLPTADHIIIFRMSRNRIPAKISELRHRSLPLPVCGPRSANQTPYRCREPDERKLKNDMTGCQQIVYGKRKECKRQHRFVLEICKTKCTFLSYRRAFNFTTQLMRKYLHYCLHLLSMQYILFQRVGIARTFLIPVYIYTKLQPEEDVNDF